METVESVDLHAVEVVKAVPLNPTVGDQVALDYQSP